MSNVTIKVRIAYAGDFFGSPIGFNGSEYRCRYMGRIYRARTLSALKQGLTNLFLAIF
jgi:hypothetical protein